MATNSRTGVLFILGIIAAVTLGGTQLAMSKGHKHVIKTTQAEKQVVTAAFDVGGDFVSCPGGYTATGGGIGYVEGVAADEGHTVGRLMPAEVAAFALGPVLAIAGVAVVAALHRSGAQATDTP